MFELNTAKVAFLDEEYEKAAEMFYEGATEGNAEAAFNYAYCLMNGYGVERDPSLARSFYTFASAVVGEAAYNLAVMYLHGDGVKRNYRKTFEYMKDAAELGVIEAQLYLGVAYTLGSLFEPDVVSISLIPYHTPEYRCEGMYIEGEVPDFEADEEARIAAVRQDPISAFTWFKNAAKHSPDYVEELSGKGKYLYARCFLDGLGTDFNRDRGNALMLLAATDGSEEARIYLETEAPYVLENLKNEELMRKIRRTEGIAAPKEY
ncbi:MAG: sel1 repeat family protein [Clostridia bacterium]|nr:sel1 repeat family protein [Clostridia bacterium]